MKSSLSIVFVIALVGLAGCNGIADPGHGDPYLVLNGKITNEQALTTPDNLRVALLWVNEAPEGEPYGAFKIAQETEINAEFPTFFELSVDALPPAEAMMDLGDLEGEDDLPPGLEGTSVALGSIIVYHDGNDNHALDLLDDQDTESIDTVLGTPEDFVIVYLEGEPFSFEDEGAIIRLERGFNLVELTDSAALDACDTAADACWEQAETPEEQDACWAQSRTCIEQVFEDDPPETVGLDTEIVIDLSSDPRLATMLCSAGGIEASGGTTNMDDNFDILDPETWPEGMLISCSQDGSLFDYFYEEVSGTVCQRIIHSGEGTLEWPPFEPLPDWWPCEQP
ncbi:MAG: hypothetical protein JXR96_10710 [Deltaproteobacteria bacterium]|nr:hypothetical protein [Deltaproteobacteria bacterium]